MRIAIISDVHGNIWAFESFLDDISHRGVDHILNLGDSLYGPLKPAETADLLLSLDIVSVRGNEDRILLDSDDCHSPSLEFVKSELKPKHFEWLRSLEPAMTFSGDFFLCHGTPDKDDEYLLNCVSINGTRLRKEDELSKILASMDQRFILCGHDHLPNTVHIDNGRIIINPGSVGLQAYTDDLPHYHKMESGNPLTKYAVISLSEDGDFKVENISACYDYKTAARTAEKNGRKDWADWLRTGRAI